MPQPLALAGLKPFLRPYRLPIALAGLFLVLAAGATLMFPVALKHLIDAGLAPAEPGGQAMTLKDHFLALFGVAVALGVFSAARFYTVSWLGERVTADLRAAVYRHVLQQPPAYFETTQTGEVLSRLGADTTLVQTVVGSSLSMGLRNAVMGVGALGMLVWNHPAVVGQVLLVVVLVIGPAMLLGRRVRRLSRDSQDRVADTSALAAEMLNAVSVVQSFAAQDREANRFEAAGERAFQTAVRRSRLRAAMVAFIIVANSALVLWGLYQGTQAVLAGRLSAGELGQAVVYVVIFAGAVAVLGEVWGDLLRAAGATERLMELLHAPVALTGGPRQPKPVAPAGEPALAFENVWFAYPSRPQQPALCGLQLRIEPGETVALVGASGAGKSTLFQLLLRFADPQTGTVRVHGDDVRTLDLNALRRLMAVVPQEAVLFSATAADNIRYGAPDASDAAVRAAADAAHATPFIDALPQGFDSFLGERGVRLSGGQRQRLAIARALLKDAPILLLDEATSALDAESERQVQSALDGMLADRKGHHRTTLVIAHRLATVKNADRIVVLDQGRVVEEGTHSRLRAANGAYAKLAALQFGQTADQ